MPAAVLKCGEASLVAGGFIRPDRAAYGGHGEGRGSEVKVSLPALSSVHKIYLPKVWLSGELKPQGSTQPHHPLTQLTRGVESW